MTAVSEVKAAMGEAAPVPARGNRFVAAINWTLETAAMFVMAGLAILVFMNAASRYALSAPLPWTEELVINLLVWLAALGIVLCGLRQGLICCDIVIGRVTGISHRILAGLLSLLGSGVMLYCAWLTWKYFQIFGKDKSLMLGLPKGIIIAALFFALVGLAASLLVPLFKRR